MRYDFQLHPHHLPVLCRNATGNAYMYKFVYTNRCVCVFHCTRTLCSRLQAQVKCARVQMSWEAAGESDNIINIIKGLFVHV